MLAPKKENTKETILICKINKSFVVADLCTRVRVLFFDDEREEHSVRDVPSSVKLWAQLGLGYID